MNQNILTHRSRLSDEFVSSTNFMRLFRFVGPIAGFILSYTGVLSLDKLLIATDTH